MDDLSDTLQCAIALVAPAGIRLEYDSVGMQVIAEQFTEKKFVLPIHVSGLPAGSHVRLFPAEAEVNVRMGVSHFAQVQASDIQAICKYSDDQRETLDVELFYTNPFITSAWVYPGVVEYILEK